MISSTMSTSPPPSVSAETKLSQKPHKLFVSNMSPKMSYLEIEGRLKE